MTWHIMLISIDLIVSKCHGTLSMTTSEHFWGDDNKAISITLDITGIGITKKQNESNSTSQKVSCSHCSK